MSVHQHWHDVIRHLIRHDAHCPSVASQYAPALLGCCTTATYAGMEGGETCHSVQVLAVQLQHLFFSCALQDPLIHGDIVYIGCADWVSHPHAQACVIWFV